MGDLVGEVSVGLFKLVNSSFGVMEGYISGVQFYSAGVKLGGEIRNSGVEMGILIGEVGISSLKLSASGLAGTEFSAFSMKLGREIGVDSLE
jgi:hypothetical protein